MLGPEGTLHWSENLGLLPPGFEILKPFAQIVRILPATPLAPGGRPTALPNPYPSVRALLGSGIAISRLNDDL